MELRIKQLRSALNLSRQDFGEKLGVSSDVINNIERKRNKKPVSDVFIRHLCRTFNVNEHWLRTGEGEMFLQSVYSPSINELKSEFNLTHDEVLLLETYLSMSEGDRQVFVKFINSLADKKDQLSLTGTHKK